MKSAGLFLRVTALCLTVFSASLSAGCVAETEAGAGAVEWPARSPVDSDPEMEARIAAIVSGMTLEQKIGQMTQAEIRYITPEEVRRYYIGSILNGGGSWPRMDKHASVEEWAALADAYYQASMSSDMETPIPVIWGTDAVHGHNNVAGATLFPHNIGLGAAHDPDLVRRIGRATAKAVRATGITWAFAPTLAVVKDQRWGRSYESYSSDPALVAEYAGAMVRGLQGELDGDGDVVATAKHFIGDGGTFNGVDQGENRASKAEMISDHAAGYYAALDAGVQTVMASYNSWNDVEADKNYGKMHGNRELLTAVLKERLGFDGIVVSDWNAIEQIDGCVRDRCAIAINAGVDLVMVPEDWKAFIANTIEDVRAGAIPMSRIDDAVTRILRVKMRSGLFDRAPSASPFNAKQEAVEARELGREAVRKSVVLLKNDGGVLPLSRGERILVVGDGADSLANQTGGWSLTWQGDENVNADFKTGDTLLGALRAALGEGAVVYSPGARDVEVSEFAAVIAVLGETPHAEFKGDVAYPAPMQHSRQFPADLAVLDAVAGKGVPVIAILYSGRTTYSSDLLNLSDAFVATFLPGTEISGLVDLLLRDANGEAAYDFTGRLPFAWPGSACATGEKEGVALFGRGYGLSYENPKALGQVAAPPAPATCDMTGP